MTRNEMNVLKANMLGGMHEYMRNLNDENAYYVWITYGVPDEPSEEDLIGIAEDINSWKECVDLFAELTKEYVLDECDEYTKG